jgi:DNA-binding transcriptional LysR family regulator
MSTSFNYKHLYYFWVVAKEGGMSRAAEKLDMAVQTVSAQVRELERSLGYALLKPAGRGLALTDAGITAMQLADQIFQIGESLPDRVRESASAPSMRLAIGISDGLPKLVARRLLQPVIGLSLLDDVFDRENQADYYHHYRIVNVENPRRIIEGLQLVLIELPKFREEHPQAARSLRWAWLPFLREAGDAGSPGHPTPEQLTAEVGLTEELRDALEISLESAFTPQELAAHERFWDTVSSERTLMNGKLAEGRAEGIEIGVALGVEQGMKQALQRLLATGMDEATAREVLGMPASE